MDHPTNRYGAPVRLLLHPKNSTRFEEVRVFWKEMEEGFKQVCTRPRKSARVFTSLIWKTTPSGIPSTLTLAQDFDKFEQGLTGKDKFRHV